MIVHEHPGKAKDEADVLDIVDGQQRFLSFALIALALVVHPHADMLDGETREALQRAAAVEPAERWDGVSEVRLQENHRRVVELLAPWDKVDLGEFARFFVERCTVVRLAVSHLDAAFQMFDSQNTRGRALLPTDLLKAHHLREFTRVAPDREHVLAVVEQWEATPPNEIDHLFSRLLFPVIRWQAGEGLPPGGFTAAHIGVFKGIREDRNGPGRHRWAHPLLMAKAYVDDYAARNAALIAHGALEPLEFPFQLSQPVIDGEMFFRMVDHYVRFSRALGIAATDRQQTEADDAIRRRRAGGLDDVIVQVRATGTGHGVMYTRELFGALLLAFADRFGTEDLEAAARVLARHAFLIRTHLRRVYPRSIELHALGLHGRVEGADRENLFRRIAAAVDPAVITRRALALPGQACPDLVAPLYGADAHSTTTEDDDD